jgi:hypothetical protein
MESRPFVCFEVESKGYLIKHFTSHDSSQFEIMVCDGTTLWSQRLSEDELKSQCLKRNASFEVAYGRLLSILSENLDTQNPTTHYSLKVFPPDPSVRGSIPLLALKFEASYVIGKRFVWKFTCRACPPDLLYRHLTAPLLLMLKETTRRNLELQVYQKSTCGH